VADDVADDAPPPVPCEPDVDCIDEGTQSFVSGGQRRKITVILPEDPVGAPVVFAWHYLGGSPDELIRWMQLERVADDAGAIVIAPTSRGIPGTEWDVLDPTSDNADLALFDDLLAAVLAQHQADADRVHTTGFSAGGMFTTWLTMHRGADLASSAPFSGGAPAGWYTSPEGDFPAMVTWGGPSDAYAGFSFDDASRAFASALAADGHEVITCEHNTGHQLPPNAADALLTFWRGETPAGCEEGL
jgi:poly(3-hydroxybutyrate) depolymerase